MSIKDNYLGYSISREIFDENEMKELLKEIKEIELFYNNKTVKQKIFRKRENHVGRKGDACMVSIGNPKTSPYLKINEYENLSILADIYNDFIGDILGENMYNSKLLMNWQEYHEGFDNSLPMHFDVELINGDWGKYEININEGLIPRFIMVLITENENNGAGLKIQKGEEILDIELNRGDLIIFDNTIMLHGVPESTPLKRSIIGFRSFETKPLYFNKNEFEGGIPFKNGNKKGFVKELSTKEAIENLKETGWYY